jgi:hypothetical protein
MVQSRYPVASLGVLGNGLYDGVHAFGVDVAIESIFFLQFGPP